MDNVKVRLIVPISVAANLFTPPAFAQVQSAPPSATARVAIVKPEERLAAICLIAKDLVKDIEGQQGISTATRFEASALRNIACEPEEASPKK